jgi:precorrin-6B methylase 2
MLKERGFTDVHSQTAVSFQTSVARWYIFMPKNPNLNIFWRALE